VKAPKQRVEKFGTATLYLGDCMEVIPTLPKVDLVATDPPYGIKADESAHNAAGKNGWVDYGKTDWDKDRPPRAVFDAILKCSKDQVIWGGNYFTDFLPPTMQWLIWDKGQRDFSLADFELAWSSQWKAARIFNYPRGAALQDGKVHPTQKAVAVMEWCISLFPKPKMVLDPFMGSGTTGVACAKMGIPFIGVEKHPPYFEHCCRRIAEANKQPGLLG
jgi:DNA modification methylase